MVSNKLGLRLHDLATQGKILTTEEQAQLEQWYGMTDGAEMEVLGQRMSNQNPLKRMVKQVLLEMIEEKSEFFYGLLVEALEEVGLAQAIREGRQDDFVQESVIMEMLEGKS
jgi:hypothetical protein